MFIAYTLLFLTVIAGTIVNGAIATNGIHNLEKRIEKLEQGQGGQESE